MNNLVLRKAEIDDILDIQKLSQELFEYEYHELDNKIINMEWSLSKDGEDNFKNLIEDHFVYVAEYNDNIVGYVCGKILKKQSWLNVQFSELINLYVKKDYRNNDIGKKLVSEFKNFCKENDIHHIKLCTLSSNINAIEFYKLNGFKSYDNILVYNDN
ncbi:MAG: GNAT family N-acetyltransferase [Clostridia bacterium]|nr:GNAT family N-acetyltransferase [Clostridia bacterium]